MSLQTQDVSFNSLRREWRETPFEWGKTDCILSVCDYVLDQTGIDPAAPWRETYNTERGAMEIVEQYGGVLGLFDYGMKACGFDRCEPREGLPSVVNVGGTSIASILGARRAIFRTEKHGVLEMPVPILGAWEIWPTR
jgi:hypothetical protein